MFKVTIEGIADKALGDLVAHINQHTKKYSVKVTHYLHPDLIDIPAGKKKERQYAKPTDIMSLTGKGAQKGSNREKILHTLEKLEKKRGIGTVTRKMLREKLRADGHDDQVIYQLVTAGFLKHRSAD